MLGNVCFLCAIKNYFHFKIFPCACIFKNVSIYSSLSLLAGSAAICICCPRRDFIGWLSKNDRHSTHFMSTIRGSELWQQAQPLREQRTLVAAQGNSMWEWILACFVVSNIQPTKKEFAMHKLSNWLKVVPASPSAYLASDGPLCPLLPFLLLSVLLGIEPEGYSTV